MINMTTAQLEKYCLSKKGAVRDFPFDHKTLVFKVAGKIFALTNIIETPCAVNLKCDPGFAHFLRGKHKEIVPGYHMNKEHWNTVQVEDGTLETKLIKELIDQSYDLVVASLPRAKRPTNSQL